MDIDDWNAALVKQFAIDCRPDRPLYLYCDASILAEATGMSSAADALESFCNAFTNVNRHDSVCSYSPAAPFLQSFQKWTKFREGKDPAALPFLAGLVMAVLAVTEEPLANRHPRAVYAKQRALLGLPTADQGSEMPPGYDHHVPEMFRQWNDYLRNSQGVLVGIPTALPGRLSIQGWAWSQGFIRPTDRLLIAEWCDRRNLKTGTGVNVEQLVRAFKSWLALRPREQRQFLEKIDGREREEIFADVLLAEIRNPRTYRQSGARLVNGLVVFNEFEEPNRFKIGVRIDSRLQGTEISLDGTSITLDASVDPLILDHGLTDQVFLDEGTRDCRIGDISVRIGKQNALLMTELENGGGFIEVRSAQIGRTYVALVRTTLLDECLAALEEAGSRHHSHQTSPQVPGWSQIDSIQFSRVVSREADPLLPLPMASLEVGLEGGLKLTPDTYLLGGEPFLVYPDETASVLVNEETFTGIPTDGRMSLLGLLRAGDNTVEVQGVKLGIRVVRGLRSSILVDCPAQLIRGFNVRHRSELLEPGKFAEGEMYLQGNFVSGREAANRAFLPIATQEKAFAVFEDGSIRLIERLARTLPHSISLPRLWIPWGEVSRLLPQGAVALLLVADAKVARSITVRVFVLPSGVARAEVKRTSLTAPSTATVVRILEGHWIPEGPGSIEHIERIKQSLRQGAKRDSGRVMPAVAAVASTNGARQIEVAEFSSAEDLMLFWLSELPNPSTTIEKFVETWDFLQCAIKSRKSQRSANQAMQLLRNLGHVEIDYVTRRIYLAPAVASNIPGFGGVRILSGARPRKLIDELESGADEHGLLDEALLNVDVTYFLPSDEDGRADGPTLILLVNDPVRDNKVGELLDTYGIKVSECPGEAILDAAQPLAGMLQHLEPMVLPPAKAGTFEDSRRRQMRFEATSFERPGVYKFDVHQGRVDFVFVDQDGFKYRVDPATGRALAHRLAADKTVEDDTGENPRFFDVPSERSSRTEYDFEFSPRLRALRIPADCTLHALTLRALASRSGRVGEEVSEAGQRQLGFENVDSSTAEQVAEVYGANLHYV